MVLLRITWTKSQIGYRAGHREVVRSLGLKRLNHTVVHRDNPSIRGMVHKVAHLVTVEEVEEVEETELASQPRGRKRTIKNSGKEEQAEK